MVYMNNNNESRNVGKVVITCMIAITTCCLVYLLVMFSRGSLFGSSNDVNVVSAANVVEFTEANKLKSTTNENVGIAFNYYYDNEQGNYGVKVEKKYDPISKQIKEMYSISNVYIVKSETLNLIYPVMYDEEKQTYSVTDLYTTANNQKISVKKEYNGLYIDSFEYSESIGWRAKVDNGTKLLTISDSCTNPEYNIKAKKVKSDLRATFNSDKGVYEFKFIETSFVPYTETISDKTTVYDMVCYKLDILGGYAVIKYNEEEAKWYTSELITEVPVIDPTVEEYTRSQVAHIESLDIYMNFRIDEAGFTYVQYFDNEGEYIKEVPLADIDQIEER